MYNIVFNIFRDYTLKSFFKLFLVNCWGIEVFPNSMYINLTHVSLLNSVVPNHLFIFCFWYCGKLCHLQTITVLVLFFFNFCSVSF